MRGRPPSTFTSHSCRTLSASSTPPCRRSTAGFSSIHVKDGARCEIPLADPARELRRPQEKPRRLEVVTHHADGTVPLFLPTPPLGLPVGREVLDDPTRPGIEEP